AGQKDRRRLEQARLLFEKMLTYANHLGLYSEETGPSCEALGNFHQAFTHLALISAAFNLDCALNRKKWKCRTTRSLSKFLLTGRFPSRLGSSRPKQCGDALFGIACGSRQAESCEIVSIKAGDIVLLCRSDRLLRLHHLNGVSDVGTESVSCL